MTSPLSHSPNGQEIWSDHLSQVPKEPHRPYPVMSPMTLNCSACLWLPRLLDEGGSGDRHCSPPCHICARETTNIHPSNGLNQDTRSKALFLAPEPSYSWMKVLGTDGKSTKNASLGSTHKGTGWQCSPKGSSFQRSHPLRLILGTGSNSGNRCSTLC